MIGAHFEAKIELARAQFVKESIAFSRCYAISRPSDTYAYGDLRLQLIYSCYLIKHDNDYRCGIPAIP
jgi:hypothetical protein